MNTEKAEENGENLEKSSSLKSSWEVHDLVSATAMPDRRLCIQFWFPTTDRAGENQLNARKTRAEKKARLGCKARWNLSRIPCLSQTHLIFFICYRQLEASFSLKQIRKKMLHENPSQAHQDGVHCAKWPQLLLAVKMLCSSFQKGAPGLALSAH